MTPLIDLTFILLVFFILETSFTQFREIGFHVPREKPPAGDSAGESKTLEIQLFADGNLWIRGETLDAKALPNYLRTLALAKDTVVTLKVDDAVPLQLVVMTMDELQAQALDRIQLQSLNRR
ncbi:MAG: ExbD/TolR family protein [Porticoccaceae bacterium]